MPAPAPTRDELLGRAHAAAERIAKHVPVSKMEALAVKIEDPKFRDSIMFKSFLNSLK